MLLLYLSAGLCTRETEHEYQKLQMALDATSESMSADVTALRKNVCLSKMTTPLYYVCYLAQLQEREEAFQSMAQSNEQLAAALKEAECDVLNFIGNNF